MSCGGCSKIVKGAIGLTKSALQIDRAEPEVIQSRRDICRECEHATRNPKFITKESKGLTNFSQCRKCSCFIAPKTTLREQSCPLGKWSAIKAINAR